MPKFQNTAEEMIAFSERVQEMCTKFFANLYSGAFLDDSEIALLKAVYRNGVLEGYYATKKGFLDH